MIRYSQNDEQDFILKFFEDFQFISIDAEGMDFEILRAIPIDALKACRLLCIEPNNSEEREEMRAWLSEVGFKTCRK